MGTDAKAYLSNVPCFQASLLKLEGLNLGTDTTQIRNVSVCLTLTSDGPQ
jgi:hypothetical protein